MTDKAKIRQLQIRQWSADIEEHKASRLTVGQWCEEHEISKNQFYYRPRAVRADRPVSLLRNSILTASLAAGIINWKYVNSVPINRLAKEFEQQDILITPQNMCNWVVQSSDLYLERIYDRLKGKMSGYHVVHADEQSSTASRRPPR